MVGLMARKDRAERVAADYSGSGEKRGWRRSEYRAESQKACCAALERRLMPTLPGPGWSIAQTSLLEVMVSR